MPPRKRKKEHIGTWVMGPGKESIHVERLDSERRTTGTVRGNAGDMNIVEKAVAKKSKGDSGATYRLVRTSGKTSVLMPKMTEAQWNKLMGKGKGKRKKKGK